MTKLVFDIGGTNTRIAPVTEEGIGDVTKHHTPQDPYELLSYLEQYGDVDAVAGGFAGIINEEGEIASSTNLSHWQGFRLRDEIASALSARAFVHNDAELAALGEALYGAGNGYKTVAYIGLGTGIGTARIVDGHIQAHSSDGAMRYGVITLSDNTTLEERVGGAALMKAFGKEPKDLPRSVWEEGAPLLQEAIQNAITQWSPDVVVLGGSLMNEENGFRLTDATPQGIEVPVLTAVLKDNAGLWGARALLSY